MILLYRTLELILDIHNIQSEFVGLVLIDIPFSNILRKILFLPRYYKKVMMYFGDTGMNGLMAITFEQVLPRTLSWLIMNKMTIMINNAW